MGFELSIIMPLSWFPLISDYTSLARTKKGALIAPFFGYFIGSCWMYAIGMAGGLLSGSPDPTKIMLAANLGLTALAILGLSTVTTTFLDVYSAGISLINIFPKVNDRMAAVGFAVIGTAIALIFPIERYMATVSLVSGIAFYYLIKAQELPVGSTLTTIIFTSALHFVLRRWRR
jgi:purine-cytosine permease-like protein